VPIQQLVEEGTLISFEDGFSSNIEYDYLKVPASLQDAKKHGVNPILLISE